MGVEHNVVFFFEADIAGLGGGVKCFAPVNYPPADSVGFSLSLQLPDVVT